MRLLEKLESLYNTRSMLATYAALARLAFQRYLAYRTANLAGLATNAFFGALRAYILIALFGAQTHVAGYSVQGAV
ncbi:MAG: hypothetical protein HYR71_10640, partial [Chloroflexi bacterium]|nr:hypothetical protein [Chloroflexota bacterium]